MRASRDPGAGAGAGACTAAAVGIAAGGDGNITGAFTGAAVAAGARVAGGGDEQPTKTASSKQQKAWRIRFSGSGWESWPALPTIVRQETAFSLPQHRTSSDQRRTAVVRLIISAAKSVYCFRVSNSMTAGPIMGGNHAFGMYSPW